MACTHKDARGFSLKYGVDYLGELYQLQIVKQLPSLPRVMIVNNYIKTEEEVDASSAVYSYQFQDSKLKKAKKFAKKSLNCQAFRVNQYQKKNKIAFKIDEAIGTLIEEIIKKEELKTPNVRKAMKENEPNFFQAQLETY